MRSLKDQKVFGRGFVLNALQTEYVFHLAGPERRRLSKSSVVDLYYRAVSREDAKLDSKSLLRMAVGIVTFEYKIDIDQLNKLIRESRPFLKNNDNYSKLRWHDIALLLVLQRFFATKPDRLSKVNNRLDGLVQLNSKVAEQILILTTPV